MTNLMLNRRFFQFLPALLCCTAFSTFGTTVYKTVDAQGNIQYSDQAPATEDLDELLVEQIILPTYPDKPAEQDQQLEQISETADRLKQDRLARDELKLKQQQAQQTAVAPIYPQTVFEENHYYPQNFRHFRNFPSIHKFPHHNNHHRDGFIDLRNNQPSRSKLLTPKSKLITP